MVELKGKITILKTLEREHCKKLWKEYEIDEEHPTQALEPGKSIEYADNWFEDIQDKQGQSQYYLGIFTTEHVLVGDIQLANIDWKNRTAEIGFGISKEKDRGRGYCSDAVKTILRFAFDHLDLYRISASTVEFNESAIKVLERNNFELEGKKKKAVLCSGDRYDLLVYSLLRKNFDS